MGGQVKNGFVIIGGVVREEVRDYFDKLVESKIFVSRSKAVGQVLTDFAKRYLNRFEERE